ncbi:nucleoside monophosphate kinase, partial [Trichocoleus sp. ST-U3]
EELDFLLEELGQHLNWAIYLQVSESVMMNRSLERSRTSKDSAINSRLDDQPEIIQRRINLFHERLPLLLEYYGYHKRLLTINSEQPPEQVQQDILQKLTV